MTYLLMMSILMALSTSNWVIMWTTLEMNMLCMCLLLSKDMKNTMESQKPTMLYLMVQMIASMILITSSFFMMKTMMILSCVVKMGSWPMHMWYMKMIETMDMKQTSLVIMMTAQKIIPAYILSLVVEWKQLVIIVMVTLIMPAIKLSKNMSLKSAMALSSLNNNSWLMMSVVLQKPLFYLFLTLYSTSLILAMKEMKNINTKNTTKTLNTWSSAMVITNMGGIPPLAMFWAKILVMKTMMQNTKMMELLILMVLVSCVFLYHYMWSTMMVMTKSPKKTQMMESLTPMTTIPLLSISSASSLACLALGLP